MKGLDLQPANYVYITFETLQNAQISNSETFTAHHGLLRSLHHLHHLEVLHPCLHRACW